MTTETKRPAAIDLKISAIDLKIFRARWARIREQHEARHERVEAWFDQEAAKLFFQSKGSLTQEEMAEETGKTQQWVNDRIHFGGFLHFTTAVVKRKSVPPNLTERKFRGCWEQTSGTNHQRRFRRVAEMLEEEKCRPAGIGSTSG